MMPEFEGDSQNAKLLGQTGLILPSEDIGVLRAEATKRLRLQTEMRGTILDDTKESDALIDDVVDAVGKQRLPQSAAELVTIVLTAGIALLKRYQKKTKTREVIRIVLHKIFDPTLGWYAMDYDDLKQTCDCVGGKKFFGPEDHRYLYTAVIQKLKAGPIREKCIALGAVDYVNQKICDITANFVEFKGKEL